MQLIQKFLFALAVLGFTASAASASPAAPTNGAEYTTLATAQPVTPGDKVEVIEFFSYACPHCKSFDPVLKEWLQKNADKVVFRRVHVAFTGAEQKLQRFHSTMEAMNAPELLHTKLFVALHEQGQRLYTEEALVEWAGKAGFDRAKVTDTYRSFGMQARINRAQAMTTAYSVDHWPLIAIGGRYMTSPSKVANAAGTVMTESEQHKAALTVMDFLVAKVQAEKK
jgi:protein dithiol oxidoreductase (disulfide-forming)